MISNVLLYFFNSEFTLRMNDYLYLPLHFQNKKNGYDIYKKTRMVKN